MGLSIARKGMRSQQPSLTDQAEDMRHDMRRSAEDVPISVDQ
jgi:hypothetical protein